MNNILSILIICFLCSCYENNRTEDNYNIENIPLSCRPKDQIFEFKGIKMGMDVSDFNNLKIIQEYNGFEYYENGGVGVETSNFYDFPDFKSYAITNLNEYTIFHNHFREIQLCFYKKKLFSIYAIIKDENYNLVQELVSKFATGSNCIHLKYTEYGKKVSFSQFSNDKISYSIDDTGFYVFLVPVKKHLKTLEKKEWLKKEKLKSNDI